MSKKNVFSVIVALVFLTAVGCGGNRRIRASIPVDTSSNVSIEEKMKIRAEEIRLVEAREKLEQQKRRTYSKYELQALDDIKRIQKAIQDRQRALMKAKEMAELRCGNPDLAQRVVVDPDAVNYFSWQAYWRVTFHNQLGVDVYIKMVDPNKQLSNGLPKLYSAVEYLGPGCSLTLNRSIRPIGETFNTWAPTMYSYEVTSYDNSFYIRTRYYSLYPGNGFTQRGTDTVVLAKPPR